MTAVAHNLAAAEAADTREAPQAAPRQAALGAPAGASQRLDDLAEIIRAYNTVTENLQHSHESLREQVARLQDQLASTDAQLQRSRRLAALGEMAAGIAHEIRNPLGAIQLYAAMVVEDLDALIASRRGIVDDRWPREDPTLHNAADTARKIAAAVRGLNAIVTDVLSFARDVTPRVTAVPTSQLVSRALESHRPAIEASGVRVRRLDLQRDEHDLLLRVDPELTTQALLNLVRNAVDAMAERPGSPRILTLDANREDAWVVLTVRDTGPGIAEENIDRIFNPFFTTRNTGTGLGLAIVHRIVDAHGGSISVQNDGGAVFELRLPIEHKGQVARAKGQAEEEGPRAKGQAPSRKDTARTSEAPSSALASAWPLAFGPRPLSLSPWPFEDTPR